MEGRKEYFLNKFSAIHPGWRSHEDSDRAGKHSFIFQVQQDKPKEGMLPVSVLYQEDWSPINTIFSSEILGPSNYLLQNEYLTF